MEFLIASAIGLMTAGGIYLMLERQAFAVILGTTLLSYAVNLFLFVSGTLARNLPPIINPEATGYTDPIPQALVLTAIVISFGMSAVVVMFALGAYAKTGSESVDIPPEPEAQEKRVLIGEGQNERSAETGAEHRA